MTSTIMRLTCRRLFATWSKLEYILMMKYICIKRVKEEDNTQIVHIEGICPKNIKIMMTLLTMMILAIVMILIKKIMRPRRKVYSSPWVAISSSSASTTTTKMAINIGSTSTTQPMTPPSKVILRQISYRRSKDPTLFLISTQMQTW